MTKKESKSKDSGKESKTKTTLKLNREEVHFLKRLYLKSEQMNLLLTEKIVEMIKDECINCKRKQDCWQTRFYGLTITAEGNCQNKQWGTYPIVPEFQDCSNH